MTNIIEVVYAKARARVFADSGAVHKQGWVNPGERLEVIDHVSGWHEVNRPAGLLVVENGVDVPAPVQPNYPRYFIDPVFCQNTPVGGTTPPPPVTPPPVTGNIKDALLVVLEYVIMRLKS